MRPLSVAAKRAVHAQQTGEVFVILLTLSHPQIAQPIRVCSDAVKAVSAGDEYVPFPFRITMPDEADGPPPTAQLEIDNVDRQIVTAVRSVTTGPMTLEVSVVLASQPDIVEAGPFEFSIRNVSYDALTVQGDLRFEDILNEPYPADTVTPATFPGLF